MKVTFGVNQDLVFYDSSLLEALQLDELHLLIVQLEDSFVTNETP